MRKTAVATSDGFSARYQWGYATALREIGARVATVVSPRITLRLLAAKHYFMGEAELRWIDRIADPRRQSVDVGGHHGIYSHVLARHTKWVHCYEPYPKDATFLSRAFAGRNVTVHQFALSDSEGSAELHVPVSAGGETGGQPSLMPPRAEPVSHTTVRVETKRLDQMGHTDVGFIKIDVEGHERSVVAGASDLIEAQRPALLIEVHGYEESDPVLLFQEIKVASYSAWFLDSGRWVELDRFRLGKHAVIEDAGTRGQCYRKNFLFLPRNARPGS